MPSRTENEVRTPAGVAGVVGTDFFVAVWDTHNRHAERHTF